MVKLSPREQEVYDLYQKHFKLWEIAEKLQLSFHTIKSHINSIRRKQLAEDVSWNYTWVVGGSDD